MINWTAIGGSLLGFAAFAAYVVTCVLLAVMRITGCKTQAFQAVAHLFVGGLFGAWFAGAPRSVSLYPALILSVVELGCFIADHVGK